MRLLLDTHALLWFLEDDPKLSSAAKTAIQDPANEHYLSPASLLEIALKIRIGKLTLPAPFATVSPAKLLANDIQLLPFAIAHIELLTRLPLHHRDPFDRLVVATALVEGFTIVSLDAALDAYGVPRLW